MGRLRTTTLNHFVSLEEITEKTTTLTKQDGEQSKRENSILLLGNETDSLQGTVKSVFQCWGLNSGPQLDECSTTELHC